MVDDHPDGQHGEADGRPHHGSTARAAAVRMAMIVGMGMIVFAGTGLSSAGPSMSASAPFAARLSRAAVRRPAWNASGCRIFIPFHRHKFFFGSLRGAPGTSARRTGDSGAGRGAAGILSPGTNKNSAPAMQQGCKHRRRGSPTVIFPVADPGTAGATRPDRLRRPAKKRFHPMKEWNRK